MNKLLLTLLCFFVLVPTAQAYSPPPAGNILLFFRRQAKITIELPPKLIMTPDKLLFPQAGVTYSFNIGTEQFVREGGQGPYLDHKIITTKVGAGAGLYYVVTIKDFKIDEKRPPDVNDFRLTFKPSVSKGNITNVESFLTNNTIDTARLSGPGCVVGGVSHICLKTITTVSVTGRSLSSASLWQTIPLKGIYISGNSAAPGGTLANFIQSGNALAVGRTVVNVSGQTLAPYNAANSPIQWTNIGPKLTAQFNAQSSLNKVNANIFNGSSWNLNSVDPRSPANLQSNSFTAPPEGKLWNISVNSIASGGSYHFGPGDNGEIRITGTGTIAVRGTNNEPISVVIHGKITCAPGTRFALMTEGDIIFNSPSNPNQNMSVECGAYTALGKDLSGGNITFGNGNVKGGSIKGIFVAKNNIVLPDPNGLTSVFSIDPDTTIVTNPPVLLRELLKIVFGVSS